VTRETNTVRTVRRSRLTEAIVSEVKQYIVRNNLRDGELLPTEVEFSRRLGVSRPVLREALNVLQVLGIVEVRQGSGTRVGRPNLSRALLHVLPAPRSHAKRLRDLLEVREQLEVLALQTAFDRLTAEDLAQLRTVLEAAAALRATHQSPVDEDFNFHRLIFKATRNEVLGALHDAMSELVQQSGEILWEEIQGHGRPDDSWSRHRSILEALERGDSETAVGEMRAHIRENAAAILALL
jgi:GntR family transcriptional repressor for pyruvate dehydrogenase complex